MNEAQLTAGEMEILIEATNELIERQPVVIDLGRLALGKVKLAGPQALNANERAFLTVALQGYAMYHGSEDGIFSKVVAMATKLGILQVLAERVKSWLDYCERSPDVSTRAPELGRPVLGEVTLSEEE